MRLTLVTPSLGMGGAERVAQVLANGMTRRGHHVVVVTTTSRTDFYALDSKVERIAIDLTSTAPGRGLRGIQALRTVARLPTALRRLRSAIDDTRPDLVVTFMEHLNVLVTISSARKHRVVVTEHSNPDSRPLGLGWKMLRRVAYPRAGGLVSVSAGVDAVFEWLPYRLRHVIPNPLPSQAAPGPATPPPTIAGPYLAAMGRLAGEKGFDLLIEAFRRIAGERPEWSLVIIGEGAERPNLSAQIQEAGLTRHVHLVGATPDPFPWLRAAELFVLSSRYEGFGNVIAEALACGVPVVSFDCPSGPAELVRHGYNGLLVPPEDVDALAEAMDRLMGDAVLRAACAARSASSVEHLRAEVIVRQWEALFDSDRATSP